MPTFDNYNIHSVNPDGSKNVKLTDGTDQLAINPDGSINTSLTGSNIRQPMDLQSHYQQTIQTHNAVSVATNSGSDGSWIDCDGFDKIAVTFTNDAQTNSIVYIKWSNDGSTWQGTDTVVATGTGTPRSGIVDTKSRYAKVQLWNSDTVAHTMSAWAYLKA